MNESEAANFDEKTEALMTAQEEAGHAGNPAKQARLQREIDALFAARYGTEPIVGRLGRNV